MKKPLGILCAVLLIFGVVGSAGAYTIIDFGDFSSQAVTIDFEDYPVGTEITTQYQGVTLSTMNGTGNPVIDNNESGGGQGLNGGPGDPAIYTLINQDAPVRATFTGGAVAGGAYYIDTPWFIGRGLFYDIYDNLIQTFVLDQTIDFWGLRADPGDALIGSIVFDSSGGYEDCCMGTPPKEFGADVSESYTIDNLIYEQPITEPIPEPTTMLLVGSGLLGFVGLRRKFKK